MSRPSLLCVPYRYKAGVLYSQVPSSNLGDFTVTRSASNSATRVNAAGLIETVADNVPRLDYPLGGITAGCPALLVEPSAQNLALQSANFNTTWLAQNSATVNTNTAISPDGTQNADTINLAAVSDSRVRQAITVANSTTYTISCFYKNIALTTGQTFRMRFNNALPPPNEFIATATIDLAAGTAIFAIGGTAGTGFSGTTTGRIENYGNGWYRVSMTFTVGTAGGNAGLFEAGNVDPGAVRSFYAWGAQLEASSLATSYIPTAASPVTRGNESCTATVGPFNSGSVYIAISDNDPQPGPGIHSSGALAVLGASSLNLHLSRSNNTRNRLWTQAASVIYTTTQDNLRLAFTWSGANINVFQNGTKVVTDSPYAITGVHTIRFGATNVRNRITALAVYDSVLTDVQLQSLTQ